MRMEIRRGTTAMMNDSSLPEISRLKEISLVRYGDVICIPMRDICEYTDLQIHTTAGSSSDLE